MNRTGAAGIAGREKGWGCSMDLTCSCGARAEILSPLHGYNRDTWIDNEMRLIGWERRYMGYICEACLIKEDAEKEAASDE